MTKTEEQINNNNNKQSAGSMLTNLIFNIIIPVLILTKGQKYITIDGAPKYCLILALAFPVCYFIYDYIQTKKANFISILGFVSVLLTGVIGVLQIPNEWLAIKEASVPFIIMLILLGSLALGRPIVGELIYRDEMFDKKRISSLISQETEKDIMKKSTLIVAFSFLVSTILNYVLATIIVVSDPITQEAQRNEEIGRLTGLSYIVIALPCTIIMCVAIWYIFHRLSKETGLKTEEMMAQDLRDKVEEKEKD